MRRCTASFEVGNTLQERFLIANSARFLSKERAFKLAVGGYHRREAACSSIG
ncbi:hypothetical protein JYQ62_28840 [Nostoc sp. UHCC 0702]|nr:hypothetical protein JYQ62_28840 [Nostoc sp. UHCC 0702]